MGVRGSTIGFPPSDGRSLAERAYWRIGSLLHGGSRTVAVGGASAEFGLSTRAEYLRAKSLGGERPVLTALLEELTGTETVWDVGACVGTYTCLVATKLTTGRVVGFEPEPANYARLQANLVANAPGERFATARVALSDRDGNATLCSESAEAGGGHHYLTSALATGEDGRPVEGRLAGDRSTNARPVEKRRGETLVRRGLAAPDLLKIDVQGAELDVLRGMDRVLESVETIYLEVHPEKCTRYGTTAKEVERYLQAAGYELTHLGEPMTGRPGVYFLRAGR